MTSKTVKFLAGPFTPLAVLAGALLLSLILYFFTGREMDGRYFFFPDNRGVSIGAERRGVPGRSDVRGQIDVFIDELFLGPQTLSLTHPMPRGTELRHVAVVGKTVYVDLNIRALDVSEVLPISFDEALANLQYNILYNFPRLDEVVFTVEGRQVHAPYYSGIDASE